MACLAGAWAGSGSRIGSSGTLRGGVGAPHFRGCGGPSRLRRPTVVLVHGDVSSGVSRVPVTGVPGSGRHLREPALRGFGNTAAVPIDATRGVAEWAHELAAFEDGAGRHPREFACLGWLDTPRVRNLLQELARTRGGPCRPLWTKGFTRGCPSVACWIPKRRSATRCVWHRSRRGASPRWSA